MSSKNTDESTKMVAEPKEEKERLSTACRDAVTCTVSTTTSGKLHQSPASAADLQKFLNEVDIWVNCILPFVGIGQFIFVASVCRLLRDCCKHHFENPSRVRPLARPRHQATCSDNFCCVAFSAVSCAEFWDAATKGDVSRCTLVCTCAAKIGCLPVLQWARDNNFPWNADTCADAAEGWHLETLKWAHDNGCKWDEDTCANAANNGNLETLKWAHDNGCPLWGSKTCSIFEVDP